MTMQHSDSMALQAPRSFPPFRRTLTKKDLCRLFGLVSAQGAFYYTRLRREYFTPDVLDRLGITPEAYSALLGGRPFDYETSQRIIAHFQLTAEELSVIA